MKTLEAKPFDQNAQNWKRENRLFTSTVLEAGASGQNRIGTRALRSHRTVWFVFAAQTLVSCYKLALLVKKGFSSPNDTPKPRKNTGKRRFFDSADRHEKLYGRSRLYASTQRRHETVGVLSLFSSLSFDISIKNSVQRWSSDFQGPLRVKNRKMAQGSNDLSTLPSKACKVKKSFCAFFGKLERLMCLWFNVGLPTGLISSSSFIVSLLPLRFSPSLTFPW